MELTASVMMKWLVGFLTVMLMFTVGILCFNFGLLSPYQNQANRIIEKTGGVTVKAQPELNKLNQNYHNMFILKPRDGVSGTSQGFGKTINYKIEVHVPVDLFGYEKGATGTKIVDSTFYGHTVSLVGKD